VILQSAIHTSRAQPAPLTFSWWLLAATFAALLLSEVVGTLPIYAALVSWSGYAVLRFPATFNMFLRSGYIVWLVPLFAVASTVWSDEPAVTLRAASELVLTTAFALLAVIAVRPRDMILALAAVSGAVLLASLMVTNTHHDYMTGIDSWAGIFLNKNSLAASGAVCTLASLALFMERGGGGYVRLSALIGCFFGLAITILARSIAMTVLTFITGLCLFAFSLARSFPPRYRRSYMLLSVIGAVIGGALLLAIIAFAGDMLLSLVGKDPTLTGRTVLWTWASRFVTDHLLLGVGYQAFWVQGHSYAEFLWEKSHITSRAGFHFHSLYYETFIELGLVGVCLTAFVLLRIFSATGMWAWRDPGPISGFYVSYILLYLLLQIQDVDLFVPFSSAQFLFVYAYICARDQECIARGSYGPTSVPMREFARRPSLAIDRMAGPDA
jgi:exopolysaccharide production protein ExoQ